MTESGSDPANTAPGVRNVQWLWLAAVVVLIDQITKQIVVNRLALYQPLEVTRWLNLTHMRNTGAAFSLFSGAPPWIFAALAVAVAGGILVWLWRHPFEQRWTAAALALIAGGALGNGIDRIMHGYVIDFVDFHIGDWHYPAFNVADMAIVAGAILIVVAAFWPQKSMRDGD